jgi:hypothetical protein
VYRPFGRVRGEYAGGHELGQELAGGAFLEAGDVRNIAWATWPRSITCSSNCPAAGLNPRIPTYSPTLWMSVQAWALRA